MKIEVQLHGIKKSVEVRATADRLQFFIDGRALEADFVHIANGIYSILIARQSFEVRVERRGLFLEATVNGRMYQAEIADPRRLKQGRSGIEAEGRQRVVSSMPGKVVRLLVAVGDRVESNAGLLVIEAMKMQNEVRSPKSGQIERILIVEGQAVNAGDVLAVIA